jgi:hypothetical protein
MDASQKTFTIRFTDEEMKRGEDFALKITESHFLLNKFLKIHVRPGETKFAAKKRIDWLSLMAEWAVARFLGVSFNKKTGGNSDGGIDFVYNGRIGQVKQTEYAQGRFLIDTAKMNGSFDAQDVGVLVTNRLADPAVILRGWVARERFWREKYNWHDPSSGRDYFAMDQRQLSPMGTLKEYLDDRMGNDGTLRLGIDEKGN